MTVLECQYNHKETIKTILETKIQLLNHVKKQFNRLWLFLSYFYIYSRKTKPVRTVSKHTRCPFFTRLFGDKPYKKNNSLASFLHIYSNSMKRKDYICSRYLYEMEGKITNG
jgi:hypothetical protein